jgi:CheY-like chemotaxis protein
LAKLNWIENHAFDLIITDIQMPVDGFLFIKELQNAKKPIMTSNLLLPLLVEMI